MTTKIESYIDSLKLNSWFRRIFDEKKSAPPEYKATIADSLMVAVEIWNKEFERRCDEWENLRVQLVENQEWVKNFYVVREAAFNALSSNNFLIKLTTILSKEYHINHEQFISELPFMGAWGEKLLGFKSGFYMEQIPCYKEGFWVCKAKDDQYVLY